jgi:VWFA-related protein
VVATDERGQPVTDLTAADFRITDAGKAQKVTILRQYDSRRRPAGSPRPGEYSNRAEANVPRATLILFDMLNEDADMQGSVGDFLARELQSLESADYLYLYLLTPEPRLYPVRGLPGTEAETPGAAGAPWTKNIKALMEQSAKKANTLRRREMRVDERVRLTHSALERIGALLARVPGRKSLVWVTRGVPLSLGSGFDEVDYEPWFRRLGLAFARAAIAVYPVQQGGAPSAGYLPLRSQDTLRLVAELTGGPKTADAIGAAVRQAMSDVRSGYVLGYYPPQENWDGGFHKVLVSCDRKGVRLQVKAGYDATDQAADTDEAALDGALASSFDAADIGIRGSASAGTTPPGVTGGRMTHFEFRIEPSDLRLTREGDRYTARLALQLAGFLADGKAERLRVVPLDVDLSAEEHAKAAGNGLLFTRDVLLGETVKRMRLVVFDRGTHAVGSLTIPLNLPQR